MFFHIYLTKNYFEKCREVSPDTKSTRPSCIKSVDICRVMQNNCFIIPHIDRKKQFSEFVNSQKS